MEAISRIFNAKDLFCKHQASHAFIHIGIISYEEHRLSLLNCRRKLWAGTDGTTLDLDCHPSTGIGRRQAESDGTANGERLGHDTGAGCAG